MNRVHYNAVDLNLLRILSVLAEERSVTKTGSRLGLTQSAVSHALARLRAIFGDPLFVRGPQGMQATQRALELASAVRAGLSQIENVLSPQFESATTDRRFTIVGGAYVCMVLAPSLIECMAEHAPHAKLHLKNPTNDMFSMLDTGQVDVILGGYMTPPERFDSTPLFEDQFVWVVRAGHPVADEDVSVEKLAALRFVALDTPISAISDAGPASVSAIWYDRGAFDAELSRRNLVQQIGAVVPDALSGLGLVARSDMATLSPRRLVHYNPERSRFKIIEPPYISPTITITAIHRRDRSNNPAGAWLLTVLAEAARTLS